QSHKLNDEQSHKLNDEQSHKLNDEQSDELNNTLTIKSLINSYENINLEDIKKLKQEFNKHLEAIESLKDKALNTDGSYKSFFEFTTNQKLSYKLPNPKQKIETVDDLRELNNEVRYAELLEIARPIREGKKRGIKKSSIMHVILLLSMRGFLTVKNFSELLGRKPASLRRDYLSPLVKDDLLKLAYPSTPTHALQGYRSNLRNLSVDLTKYDN
ncbi:hypothetical protein ABN101_13775, partial [Proteus vulgaris]